MKRKPYAHTGIHVKLIIPLYKADLKNIISSKLDKNEQAIRNTPVTWMDISSILIHLKDDSTQLASRDFDCPLVPELLGWHASASRTQLSVEGEHA